MVLREQMIWISFQKCTPGCHTQERMEKGTVETGMIQTHWEVRTKSAMSQVLGACKRQGTGGKDIHKRPEGEQQCAMEQTRTFLFLGSVAWILPGGSVVKNPPSIQEPRVWSLGWEDSPGEGEWQPTLVFLPGESHGQRSLAGYSPWGCKEWDPAEWLTL